MRRLLSGLTIALVLAAGLAAQSQKSKDLTSGTCTSSASTGCLYIDTSNLSAIGVQVTGTYAGTIVFEQTGQQGDGATFVSLTMSPADGTTAVTGPAANAVGMWTASIAARQVRIRMSAYTSGTAVVSTVANLASHGSGGSGGGAGGSAPLTGTGSTITASAPLIDVSQTWNNAGVTFTAITAAITSTASAAASKLMDLTVGGASQFSVTKAGAVRATNTTGSFGFTSIGQLMPGDADGRLILGNNAGTDFSTLYFGPQNSTHAAINANGTTLTVIRGDLGANADLRARQFSPSAGITMSGTIGDANVINSTRPTITSGFGTSPTIQATFMAGTLTFTVTVGTGSSDTTGVLAFPAANARWNCMVTDQTTAVVTRQTAATTTSATFTAAAAWTAGDVLIFICAGQ